MADVTERMSETVLSVSRRLSRTAPEGGGVPAGFRSRVVRLIELIRRGMFPDIFGTEDDGSPTTCLFEGAILLERLLGEAGFTGDGEETTRRFLESLPETAELLRTDVQAAYDGDPAARSTWEIMLTYPAFEAISIYRLAHTLYSYGVPLLPRFMTEYAHRNTGIDIHPGASIGPYFFIDHGTGVVIGETCTIGDHVKLYQGVTLGAKSFELDENGNPVKGIKRQPDIGSRVVIYAGATILGGRTVIGDGCTVGGNVWLTHSLPAGETITYDVKASSGISPA